VLSLLSTTGLKRIAHRALAQNILDAWHSSSQRAK